jgi:hypothetical protein
MKTIFFILFCSFLFLCHGDITRTGTSTGGYTHPNHTGDVISSGDGDTTLILRSNVDVKSVADQLNITKNIWTQVVFDSEITDVANEFAANAFTANLAGYYQVIYSLSWQQAIPTFLFHISLYKNGASIVTNNIAANGTVCSNLINKVIHLNVGDILTFYCYNASNADTPDIAESTSTYVSITRIGS